MGVSHVLATICGIIVLFGYRITAELLFSQPGPFTPANEQKIGTTAVRDNMHLEFDVKVNSVQEKGWREVFSVMGDSNWSPALFFHDSADDVGGQFEGWSLTFQRDEKHAIGDALVAGECYHFELDWTQSSIFVKINGETVWDKPDASNHTTWDSHDIFMSWTPNQFLPADVTVENFVISTDLSCWVASFECTNGELCGTDGECCTDGACPDADSAKCLEDRTAPCSCNSLTAKVEALENTVGSLGGKVTTFEGEVTKLEATVGSLGGSVTTPEGTMSSLGGKVTTIDGKVTTLEGTVTTLEDRVAALENMFDEAVNRATNRLDALEQTVQSLEGTIAAVRGVLQNYLSDSGTTSVPLGLTDYVLYALVVANAVMVVCLLVYCVSARVSAPAAYGKVVAYDTVDTEKP